MLNQVEGKIRKKDKMSNIKLCIKYKRKYFFYNECFGILLYFCN